MVSDDASAPEHYERIRAELGDDPRFLLSRSEERLGFYRNFERALRLVPAEAELVALCDQDDRWHPDKLATLRDALGDAGLVYSDQRLVDADGRVLRDTLWQGRRNNYDDLTSMLVANTITGAAMLMRRELVELALPFPDTPGLPFHDAWLAVVALAAGEVAYVDRPLYDYVQHRGAFFGSVTHGEKPPRRRRERQGELLPRLPAAGAAGGDAAAALRAGHPRSAALCSASSPPSARLRAFLWLAARPLRMLRGRTETLGARASCCRGCSGAGWRARRGWDAASRAAQLRAEAAAAWRARV